MTGLSPTDRPRDHRGRFAEIHPKLADRLAQLELNFERAERHAGWHERLNSAYRAHVDCLRWHVRWLWIGFAVVFLIECCR